MMDQLRYIKMKQWSVIVCFILINYFTSQAQELVPIVKSVPLGDQTVTLKVYTKPGKSMVYVHVHENEVASLEAGLAMLHKYGGKLVTLAHSNDGTKNRNVTFTYHKTTYRFDPNRIYTQNRSVLASSISVVKGKGKVDDAVIDIVQNLANQIWEELKDETFILAIHNNKNAPAEYKIKWLFWKHVEPESFSIKSYIKSHDKSSDSNLSCSDIYINPEINNSEFFIVTQKDDFDQLVKKRYTVVLQNANPVDDGSMSVYASIFGKRYINAEAKMGRVDEQVRMLEILMAE
jgi:hypothetical protein